MLCSVKILSVLFAKKKFLVFCSVLLPSTLCGSRAHHPYRVSFPEQLNSKALDVIGVHGSKLRVLCIRFAKHCLDGVNSFKLVFVQDDVIGVILKLLTHLSPVSVEMGLGFSPGLKKS
jgi:hypothetical protein